MSLSVEQVRQMREQIKANDAAKTAAQKKTTTQTAKTTPAAPAAKSAGTGLSVAQVAQIRSQMTAAPASTSRLQTTASTPAWTGGTRQVLGTVSADTLGKQVLADMASNTGSPVATDRQEDYEPLELCWQRQRPETAGHCAGHLRQLRQGGAEGGKRPCQGPADRPL